MKPIKNLMLLRLIKCLTSWPVLLLLFSVQISDARSACTGHFVNPVTDICWDCLFPLTIGSVGIVPSSYPDTPNPTLPICLCGAPIPRIGVSFGYWEPFALVDVTKEPFCMVNIGGKQIQDKDIENDIGGTESSGDQTEQAGFYWVHWYKYPVMYWLNIITSLGCLESGDMDIAYMAELDPTWHDDSLTLVLNPEAILFGNPVSQMACIADALKTVSGHSLSLDPLFWCMGGQGSSYPLDGTVPAQVSPIQASVLEAEKMAYKLHREGIIWDTVGADGAALCQAHPTPIIPKSRYRYQMVNTIPEANQCFPFGTDTINWESGHMPLQASYNSGYLIWRKRNCCFL